MMHPIKSVIARHQSWTAGNYNKTKYGRSIAKLKNMHKGEVCFVIGNGPSLKPEDLQQLHTKHIDCFGTNRIFKIFGKTDWRPKYFVSEDVIIIQGIQKEISDIPSDYKFIPINLHWYENVDIKNATYFYMNYNENHPDDVYGLSVNLDSHITCRATVSLTCLQFAIYMGYSKIYLLGVDHNFAKMFDKNGNVVEDKSIKNHFTDDYDKDIIDQGFQIDGATQAYLDVERLSKKTGTFKVYNATRGGKLEVFERVDFDEVIKEL